MSSEIFEYLLANRHTRLLNVKAEAIVDLMKKYPHAYDFQSSVHIHIGNISDIYDDWIKSIHLIIITDYKLFMVIEICSVDYGDRGSYYDTLNECLFTCDEISAIEAIKYISDNNYEFDCYDDVLKNIGLVIAEDGLIDTITFADFMPRTTKSGRSMVKSNDD